MITKLKKFLLLEVKNEISKYNKDVIEASIGLLLSDGHLRNSNVNRKKNKTFSKGNYYMSFTFKVFNVQGESMMGFNNWLKFNVLWKICTKSSLNLYPKNNPTQCTFNTKSLILFTKIYPFFYNLKNKKKIINQSFLMEYFNGRVLAFMLMGDGYWDNREKTVYICTECYSLEDINKLLFVFRHKLNLIVSTRKRKGNLRIRFSSKGNNLKLLRQLTKPHFHLIMLYKLGLI